MNNSRWVAFGLVIVVTIGLSRLTPSALADGTATPTVSPAATGTLTSTLTPTRVASSPTPTASLTQTLTASPTVTRRPTVTATLAVTLSLTSTPATSPEASATPTVTGTIAAVNVSSAPKYVLAMDPKALDIDTLRARTYGGSQIKITRTVSNDIAFKKAVFEYQSDGLRITGMMNIPRGTGPFPVVILNHGYFKPSEFKTGDGTNPAADNFARNGYLTLASDYRCYGGSQCGANPLYVGYAIDVLNLIGSLSSLPEADTNRIGIWGHSMGGGITLRVLAVSSQIKVASLYGALTGDDEVQYCWLNGCRTSVGPLLTPRVSRLMEVDPDFALGLPTPGPSAPDPLAKLKEIFLKSSPSRHLNYINTPMIIHHGESDDIVPIQWSVDLAEALTSQGKVAELYTYPGEGHVFTGWNWQLFMARTVAFFDRYLIPREAPITIERRVLRQERGISDLGY